MIIEDNICFECEKCTPIHNHHVVPKVFGGTKTVPLCEKCHGIIHGMNFLNHGKLIKAGLNKSKIKGVKLGNPKNLTNKSREKSIKTRTNKALLDKNNIKAVLEINFLKENYKFGFNKIAKKLNDNNFKTSKGNLFTSCSVRLLYIRDKTKIKQNDRQ